MKGESHDHENFLRFKNFTLSRSKVWILPMYTYKWIVFLFIEYSRTPQTLELIFWDAENISQWGWRTIQKCQKGPYSKISLNTNLYISRKNLFQNRIFWILMAGLLQVLLVIINPKYFLIVGFQTMSAHQGDNYSFLATVYKLQTVLLMNLTKVF